jgi:type I protein arginine methyltransferase
MYSTRDYGAMIADKVRMQAYTEALRAAVKPSDVVLDLGAGTGIFALLACQYGAAQVYAVEPNENIQVAKQLARENGFSDRIQFIQDISTKVTLPDQADVIISDLRGLLPLHGKHIPALVDARKRLLKPGGILIPTRDTLNVCVVEAPELYKEYVGPWDANPYQLRLERARERVTNTWSTGRAKGEQVLTQGQAWGVLDYHHLESSDMQGKLTQRFFRDGTAHGLIVWFDAELIEGIGFSNAPDCQEHAQVYGSAFFPFTHPVDVSENDRAHLELNAVLVNDMYTWRWNTHITSGEDQTKASFAQSTFYGTIFSSETLRKRQPGYRPTLNSKGLIEHFIQQHMDGEHSLEAIAQKLLERFPDQFSSLQEAIERAGDSSQNYGN